MSRPVPMSQRKRKLEDGMKGKTQKPRKKIRKQKEYHSSTEEEEEENSDVEFTPVNLNDSEEDEPTQKPTPKTTKPPKQLKAMPNDPDKSLSSQDESEATEDEGLDEDDGDDSDSQPAGLKRRKTAKRNDPEAFSTSMSKILSTKLSQSARKDPVLSRSRDAMATSSNIANERLEQRAKAKIRADKKEESERGRIKDVLGLSTGEAGKIAEEEKRLRKIAQRGVVKLFNAVRAAQVRGEQAAREERKKGTVGMANREEKVNEMSKQGFLELISGKPKSVTEPEET